MLNSSLVACTYKWSCNFQKCLSSLIWYVKRFIECFITWSLMTADSKSLWLCFKYGCCWRGSSAQQHRRPIQLNVPFIKYSFTCLVWGYFGFGLNTMIRGRKEWREKKLSAIIVWTVHAHLPSHHPAHPLSGSSTAELVTLSVKEQQSSNDSFKQTYPCPPQFRKTHTRMTFVAKDLQPYLVVRDLDFCHLIKTIDPC